MHWPFRGNRCLYFFPRTGFLCQRRNYRRRSGGFLRCLPFESDEYFRDLVRKVWENRRAVLCIQFGSSWRRRHIHSTGVELLLARRSHSSGEHHPIHGARLFLPVRTPDARQSDILCTGSPVVAVVSLFHGTSALPAASQGSKPLSLRPLQVFHVTVMLQHTLNLQKCTVLHVIPDPLDIVLRFCPIAVMFAVLGVEICSKRLSCLQGISSGIARTKCNR